MPEAVAGSAEARIIDAFYTLLREKPYAAIKVTEIIRLADVNRSTFYKNYTSVPDLFQKQQQSLCNVLRTLPLEKANDADALRAFTHELLRRFLAQYQEKMTLLGGDHGDVRTFWQLGDAIRARLDAEADKSGVSDPAVRRNIESAPGFFSSLLCYHVYRDALRQLWLTYPTTAYDTDKSFFENVAVQLQLQRGGSVQFHYDLLLSYVKHFNQLVPRITVTQLLQTAGIGRTEFYQYYQNLGDFHKLYISTIRNCATLYITNVCRSDAQSAANKIAAFTEMNYTFVQKTVRGVMERGDIIYYVTTLIGSVFALWEQQEPFAREYMEKRQYALLYYIGACVSYALMFYAGALDKTQLLQNLQRMDAIRQKIGLEGEPVQ